MKYAQDIIALSGIALCATGAGMLHSLGMGLLTGGALLLAVVMIDRLAVRAE